MGLFNGKEATVWMRATRPHTYEGILKVEGEFYLAHEEMVETIEILKMAVREAMPAKAKRPPTAPAKAAAPANPAPPAPASPARVMTTADLPNATRGVGPVIDGTKR